MISFFLRIYQKCKKDDVNGHAAQSALFIILSGIPFLIVMLSLFQLTTFGMADLYTAIRTVCPEYFHAFLISLIDEMYDQSIGLLSVTAVIALWSAAKGIQYMASGLNVIYGSAESRNWWIMRFWALLYTVVFAAVFLVLLCVMIFQKNLYDILTVCLEGHTIFLFLTSWLRWLLLLVLLVVFFCIVFTALPNRKLDIRKQFPGALFSAIGWIVFSYGLSVYVDYFNGFSLYGSLTTAVLLMFWVYVCVFLLMLGGEINTILYG